MERTDVSLVYILDLVSQTPFPTPSASHLHHNNQNIFHFLKKPNTLHPPCWVYNALKLHVPNIALWICFSYTDNTNIHSYTERTKLYTDTNPSILAQIVSSIDIKYIFNKKYYSFPNMCPNQHTTDPIQLSNHRLVIFTHHRTQRPAEYLHNPIVPRILHTIQKWNETNFMKWVSIYNFYYQSAWH